jgi:hypothetical protein
MNLAVGTTIPRSQLPGTWSHPEQPPLTRIEDSPTVHRETRSYTLELKPVTLLTALFDCPFCGMSNEVVIDGFSDVFKACSHCDAYHFIDSRESPPRISASIEDGGMMDAEVIPLARPQRKGRKS